ncbi:MAG: hypothetical protein PSN34_13815 [Urechidicola sp.]|nr:hypothetical protein [Urechidicola sp.]
MKIFLTPMLFLLLSCGTHNIEYNREKIIKKYSMNFDILVDSNKTDFKNLYLNKDNIKKTTVDKKNKVVNIFQKTQSEFIKLNSIYQDSLNSNSSDLNNKISLIVINGIPIMESEKSKILFDQSAINELKIIDAEINSQIFCRITDDNILIINTK